GGLVDQQESGLGRERAREFEQTLLAIRERTSELVALCREADESEQFERFGVAARMVAPECRPVYEILPGRDIVMDVKSCDHIVQHRELLEQTNLLKRARNTEPDAAVCRQTCEVGAG